MVSRLVSRESTAKVEHYTTTSPSPPWCKTHKKTVWCKGKTASAVLRKCALNLLSRCRKFLSLALRLPRTMACWLTNTKCSLQMNFSELKAIWSHCEGELSQTICSARMIGGGGVGGGGGTASYKCNKILPGWPTGASWSVLSNTSLLSLRPTVGLLALSPPTWCRLRPLRMFTLSPPQGKTQSCWPSFSSGGRREVPSRKGGMNVDLTGEGGGKTDGQCPSSRRAERSFVLHSSLNVAH